MSTIIDGIQHIRTRKELQELAKTLGTRKDWHEPDEQSLTAITFGRSFDNCGHWGLKFLGEREAQARKQLWNPEPDTTEGAIIEDAERFVEMFVVLYREDKAVAEINLATLFAFACGTDK